MKGKKIISVDIDGTLTIDNGKFWKGGIDNVKPNKKIINWVRNQYWAGNIIIIYTARKELHRPETQAWLDKYVVWYHALVMNKLRADIYLDDRNMKLNEIGGKKNE